MVVKEEVGVIETRPWSLFFTGQYVAKGMGSVV
jgi:hypothetical protein